MIDHYPAGSRAGRPPAGTTQPPIPVPPPAPRGPRITAETLAVAREITGLVCIIGGMLGLLFCLLALGGVLLLLLGISGLVIAGGFVLITRRSDV